MRKNLKLFSIVLIASLMSNSSLGNSNFLIAEARSSQHPAIVNNSSNENGSSTTTDENNDDTIDESGNSDNIDNNLNDDTSTTILEVLNNDSSLDQKDIADLAAPISYSPDFIDELKTIFPDLEPLRRLSPLTTSYNPYLDVLNNELVTLNSYLDPNPEGASIYGDQNVCNILIKEISRSLEEINDLIKEQYNSTIFSLMPTLLTFSDTFNILHLKYSSIVESNYENQVTLNILLYDIQPKLYTLLESINIFKTQLPDLIDTLNELVDNNQNSGNTSSDQNANEETTDEEITDEESNNEQTTSEGETTNNESSNNTTTESQPNNNTSNSNGSSENTNSENESTNQNNDNSSNEEEVDPSQVMIYFGEDGQELIYNEKEDKFYEINPDDPNLEELIEYSGEVTEMTLKDYLSIELYFDSDGNELIYDEETDEYLIYDADTDEYLVYEGEVTSMTMEEYLNQYY